MNPQTTLKKLNLDFTNKTPAAVRRRRMVWTQRARHLSQAAFAAFILAGYGLSASSLYPWPDPRHMVISLGLGIQIAPLLMLWGLRRRTDVPRLKLFLISAFAAMAVLTLFTKHLVLPGTVNDLNVGWWETAYATVLIGWAGVAALMLERAVRAEAAQRGSATTPA